MADKRPGRNCRVDANFVSISQESAIESSSSALRVTLLADEWGSSKGGLSTINRELAKQLAKLKPDVEVTFLLPKCSGEDKKAANDLGITIEEAEERPGYEPVDWLAFPPKSLSIDVVVGHGVKLGRQAQIIRDTHNCKWVQVVHTAPEELSMYKTTSGALHRGEEKHQAETQLCGIADFVVAVGPKLADNFSAYLRSRKKEVFNFTPGVFDEFSCVEQASGDGKTFRVLVFGRGDSEDVELKGYDIAAQAVATLNDSSYHLIFVGALNGKEEEIKNNLLKRNISRSQLTVRGFAESREKVSDLLCEADLAIMPSRTEGFGLTGVEALSAGLPILVSRNSGFGEALKTVSFGSYYVVDSEDANTWANAIKKVREKERQVRLDESKTLRSNYAKRFNWQKQCKDLVKWLRTTNQDFSEGGSGVSDGADSACGASSGEGSLPRLHTDFHREETEARKSSLPQNVGQAQKRSKPTSDNQKEGTPSDEELEELSRMIGDKWKPLGRRLVFTDAELTAFHKENEEYDGKAYQMLLAWKQRDHPGRSGYRILYKALSHKLVCRKDLAEEFCCVSDH